MSLSSCSILQQRVHPADLVLAGADWLFAMLFLVALLRTLKSSELQTTLLGELRPPRLVLLKAPPPFVPA